MYIALMRARPIALKFSECPLGDTFEIESQSQEGDECDIYVHTSALVNLMCSEM
jgi:hypothetical protein